MLDNFDKVHALEAEAAATAEATAAATAAAAAVVAAEAASAAIIPLKKTINSAHFISKRVTPSKESGVTRAVNQAPKFVGRNGAV